MLSFLQTQQSRPELHFLFLSFLQKKVRIFFSFGHPNVESIVDRFLARNPSQNIHDPFHLVEARRNASVGQLNFQLSQILAALEVERKRGENLDEMRKTNERGYWWEAPVDKLGLDELEQLKDAMEDLKKNVTSEQVSNTMSLYDPIFTWNGVPDQFDCKPNTQALPLIMGPIYGAGNSNLGYCHGFF